jgi:hypothetical protein
MGLRTVLCAATVSLAAPLAAQDDPAVTQEAEAADDAAQEALPIPPPRRREVIDLTITRPRSEPDRLLQEDCEEEADAGRIAGEIVVCRQLGEASDGAFDKEDWERRYAARTQGGQPVDVAGGGIFRGPATIGGMCLIPPCPPEAALMIDVEGLPEAPPGSDADRIARGLPPTGEEEGPSPEEIARRRRALGLEAPEVPPQ